MSFAHFSWFSAASTERPMILTFRLSNSGFVLAMWPVSVVHTGVKSFGCEKSTPQESPSHSWKWIGPSVVCASKSGAVSPIVSSITTSLSGDPNGRVQLRKTSVSLRRFHFVRVGAGEHALGMSPGQRSLLFREVNDQIYDLLESGEPDLPGEFLCECGRECGRRV